jgi:predicted Rossmann fold nucleotide-binding protein DprA/Smf involved in DNA uptake
VTEAGGGAAGLGTLLAGYHPPPASADTALMERPLPAIPVRSADRDKILEALGVAPIGLDDLIRLTGVEARQVRVVLMELEIAGRVQRLGGQRVALSS